MNTLSLILTFFLIQTTSSQKDECFTTSCDGLMLTPIRFPFRSAIQPPRCGYPGFNLTCDGSGNPILRLKNSSFIVRTIDYANQQIWLNDPSQCFPRILLTLDFWTTRFKPMYSENFTLFNCSRSGKPPGFSPINCLSGENYTVVASGSIDQSTRLSRASCRRIKAVSVPPLPATWPSQDRWMSGRDQDFQLTWFDPQCGECDSEGGICRLKHNSNHDVQCKIPGEWARHLRYVISLALGIPTSIFIFGIVIFLLKKFDHNTNRSRQAQSSSIEIPPVVNSQPNTMSGLDQAAIESFPKTVLSESMGLPNTEDNTCPICLGEYKPKESIRTFPTCKHSFHSNCIDEWLHRNATCPVCRKYQKESTTVQLAVCTCT